MDYRDKQFDPEQVSETLSWYAIQSRPKQEDRANGNLLASNVQTFSPQIRKLRPNPYLRAPSYEIKSLFPSYIFARFDVNTMLRKVWFTRGVSRVVCVAGVPAEVDDEIISLIRSKIAADGFVEIGDSPRVGDMVTIENGPLRGLVGILEREVTGVDRVLILLAAISYQGNVIIGKEHIKRVSSLERCACA
jgi:transcriptional antiterminator RfaH